MPAERYPSGNIASVITDSTSSYGYHLPERLHVSKMIIKDKPASDIDVNSSDKERERPRVNEEISKNYSHKKEANKPLPSSRKILTGDKNSTTYRCQQRKRKNYGEGGKVIRH